MTNRADFDRIARDWLAEGPAELSDRVLEAALEEVHLTRQRRVMHGPWRNRSMPNSIRIAIAAALVAAVGIAAFALIPRGGQNNVGASPIPSPSGSSPAPSASPTAAGVVPLPLTGRADAGTYRTDAIDPPLTFTWETGLDIHLANPGIVVTAEAGLARYIVLANAVAVVDPATGDRQPLPADLVAWLEDHPGLDAGPAQPISIGGLEGQVIEGTLSEAAAFDSDGRLSLFGVSDETSDTFPIAADQAFRIAVLTGSGGPVIVAITPRADLFDDFLPTAEAILATVEFEE
jgi:hypothetical protein